MAETQAAVTDLTATLATARVYDLPHYLLVCAAHCLTQLDVTLVASTHCSEYEALEAKHAALSEEATRLTTELQSTQETLASEREQAVAAAAAAADEIASLQSRMQDEAEQHVSSVATSALDSLACLLCTWACACGLCLVNAGKQCGGPAQRCSSKRGSTCRRNRRAGNQPQRTDALHALCPPPLSTVR